MIFRITWTLRRNTAAWRHSGLFWTGLHERGMKLVMDLVVNHTSDEHEWFQKSRRRIAPYTDYYIWRSAKPNGKLPNNWDSHFEGKAWQWDDLRQEYYLHLFAVKQPDLNMDNPLVRTEVKKILKFWLDLGVDGFREDVITFISKKEGLPDDHLFPIFKGIRFLQSRPAHPRVSAGVPPRCAGELRLHDHC